MECTRCGRDINSIDQDNVSNVVGKPLCEDCNDMIPGMRTDGCPNDCSLCNGYCVYDN